MPTAERRKVTASIARVAVAPSQEMSSPPRGGPVLVAVQNVVSNRLFATSRSSGETRAFRWAPLAAPKAMLHVVWTTPTRHSWLYVRTPNMAATGTLPSAAKRSRSAATITGRFARNSIREPSGRAIAALAIPERAASIAT